MSSHAARFPGAIVATLLSLAAVSPALVGAEAYRPAKYRNGPVPPLPPPTVVGGGEVILELDVASTGVVRAAKVLRSTPPYTDAVMGAVKAWRFDPAELEGDRDEKRATVDSTVLVVAIFKAPTLNAPTLGEVPRDVGTESDSTPYPFSTGAPAYPPRARSGGVVMIEALVDAGGRATAPRVVQSSPPFDDGSVEALRQWMFRPARIRGVATPALVYVILGFPEPVTSAAPR
jgi:TonB family protein